MDRLGFRSLLERFRGEYRDAWQGKLLRSTAEQCRPIPDRGRDWLRKYTKPCRPDHLKIACSTCIPTIVAGALTTRWQLRCSGRDAWTSSLRRGWKGPMRHLPCTTSIYRTGLEFAYSRRNRNRFLPGRSVAGSYVSHLAPQRTVDPYNRRLL